MDYVKPSDVVYEMSVSGKHKAKLSISDVLIKAMLSGSFLGLATTLAYTASIQTGFDIIGAIVFPTGFIMILILNLELVTGSFAIITIARFKKQTSTLLMFRNFTWAFIGNLLGALLYSLLFTIYVSKFGHIKDSLMIEKIIMVAETKTLSYQSMGMDGMIVLIVSAILCNWMVTMGAVMSFTSTATIGEIAAMWIPVFIFFAQGFEHAVVNMFVIPTAIFLGADITLSEWWLWNQIPVTLGNLLSGIVLTALSLHLITKTKKI